ncbi:MAG TPA: RidA family protein [Acidimicrobiia bacterium]|jgi:enamine deaminase RidA (YjgF/YER057c/UK114 family)
MSPTLINPPDLPEAIGFSHAAVAPAGPTIYLAGQSGHRADGSIEVGLLAQFAQACKNVAIALESAGAARDNLVSLHIFVTDAASYRGLRKELGQAYREVFGHHYPAMALFEVKGLFDPEAVVELVGIAVLSPDA